MTWTLFWDMHSGGGCKQRPYEQIYIEASESDAVVIFYNRFGHSPNRVSCTCCGADYSISSEQDLEQLTGFHRNAKWHKMSQTYSGGTTLEKYKRRDDILFIYAEDIQSAERIGDVPEQGYVWR